MELATTLEAVLGPATIVGESGGEWINDETGEVENKAHLHWRLKQPASTAEAQAMLYEARALATKLVGGDHTATRSCIRCAGRAPGTARKRRSWRESQR